MPKSVPRSVMPIITVDSVDELRNYYVDVLGFEHSMGVVGKDGQFESVNVVREEAQMMFSRSEAPAEKITNGAKQHVAIYLEVGDIDAYHEQLKAKVRMPMTDPLTSQWWEDRTFKIIDPAGYEVWFYQTVSDPMPREGTKIV